MNNEPQKMEDSDLQIALAEYVDLRDEIKKWVEERTRLTELMIGIVAAIGTAALSINNLFLLIIAVFSTFFFLEKIKSSYYIHATITKYIREKVEKEKLMQLLSKERRVTWTFWETYYSELPKKERERNSRRAMFNSFGLSVYVVCGLGISYQSFQDFGLFYFVASVFIYWIVCGYLVYKTRMIDPYKPTNNEK